MTVDELEVLITANTNELRKEISNANKTLSGLKKSADKGTSGVSDAFKKLKSGIVALGIGKVIKDSIQSGMDAIESDSLFTTVMGENAEAVRSWSNEVSNALGLSAVSMQKNISVVYSMTSSMGVAEENALKMSKGISMLTEDLASFRNLSSEEAFNKLRAGLTGETEPLKSIGILVDENTIKQVAYAEGIAEVGAELTQEQKVLARYKAILNQTTSAQGDLARTLDSPSNQLRSLKQAVVDLGISLSNFFMPIVKAVLPWLNAITKVATQALSSLSSFFKLTGNEGASEETQKVEQNTAGAGKNLDDATKSAKKLKSALAGFDEMNVLSEDSGSGDSASASASIDFDVGEYDAHLDWIKESTNDLVDKINGFFSSIGKGISFDNLIKSFGKLKDSVEKLGGKIWDGLKWAIDNVLKPLSKWTIEKAIPSFFESMSKALDGIGNIDFSALQEKLLVLKDSVAPFVDNVGAGLDWFLQNVLVPLAGWVIEDVAPAFLDALADAIGFLNGVIDQFRPIFEWLWEYVLLPIAEWTGGVIVDVMNGIGDALKWITENEHAMNIIEAIGIGIGVVATALGLYNIAMGIANVVTGVFSGIMAVLTSPITLVVGAIVALIAIIALCVEYWDEIVACAVAVWDEIVRVWGVVADWVNETVIQPIAGFFTGLWDGIVKVWNAVAGWFDTYVIQPIVGFFTGLWDGLKNGAKGAWDGICSVFSAVGKFFSDIFSKAWEAVVAVFSPLGSVFVSIKDGVISVFKTVVNGLIDGINFVIALPFKGLNGILDTLYGLNILGVQPFGWLTWRAPVPQLPKLARGGIVDRPTYAMVGEAGKEAVMPLERNTGWIDQLADKLAEKIGGGNGDVHLTIKLGEDKIFDKFIEYSKDKAFETGEVVFA